MLTFHFRRMDGDVVAVEADDEQAARAAAMEARWGPAAQNTTWRATRWEGRGLRRVDAAGMPVEETA